MTRFVEVAVPLPVRGTFHYRVPDALESVELVGARVMAPFGNRGISGVVMGETNQPPDNVARIRAIDRLLEGPSIPPSLLELCRWIADYYEAPVGEVIKAALPVGSSVRASQYVELTDVGADALEGSALDGRSRDLLGLLATKGGVMSQKLLVKAGIRVADIEAATEAGVVRVSRGRGSSRVTARSVRVARITRPPSADEAAQLSRAPRRRAVYDAVVAAGGEADVAELTRGQKRASDHLRALSKLGLVELDARIRRGAELAAAVTGDASLVGVHGEPGAVPDPNDAQREALERIRAGFAGDEYVGYLLHGITGSGKTEVYLRAIDEVLAQGKTAIVLVPEISLTPQLSARFRSRFGDQVAVLHSGLSDRERFDEWVRLREGVARIALGARSAVFAPVSDLGMIVVDEEHDSSFKQEEGVRYHARDVALVRAHRAGAVCILGSATPSLESMNSARSGKLELLRLPERATPRPLPTVELVDLRRFQPDGDSLLTAPLAAAMAETLEAGDQIILFLNRRGFNTYVLCIRCGSAFRCTHCAVSLTYHRHRDCLMCHYCGHTAPVTDDCAECGAKGSVVRRGLGTERVASAVASRFPSARVQRMDRDVATGARVSELLASMARREVDVLVGTQMVTKGHDFPHVTLVGVLCADTGLSLPDFRASERTFQLLAQVAGRAGRGDRPGRVIIQSHRTEAPAIAAAKHHDYHAFVDTELGSRRELGYPPFGHLVALRVDGKSAGHVEQGARELARAARQMAPVKAGEVTLLGPSEAPLARLKGRTRWHLWLRSPDRPGLRQVARALLAHVEPPGGVRIQVDVDPISAL